jgi:hypothetical protein
MYGEIDLSDWTDEELERGRRKSKKGDWSGKAPQVIARQVHDELVRRKHLKSYDLLRAKAYEAVRTLVDVATKRKLDPSVSAVRVKAATEILDRALGKPTESMRLQVDGLEPWQQLIQTSIIDVVATEKQALPAEGELSRSISSAARPLGAGSRGR